jgi:hypothetical protein
MTFETAELHTLKWRKSPLRDRRIHHLLIAKFMTTFYSAAEFTTSRPQNAPLRGRKFTNSKSQVFDFRFRHFETANSTTLTLLDSPLKNRRFSTSLRACLASICTSLVLLQTNGFQQVGGSRRNSKWSKLLVILLMNRLKDAISRLTGVCKTGTPSRLAQKNCHNSPMHTHVIEPPITSVPTFVHLPSQQTGFQIQKIPPASQRC